MLSERRCGNPQWAGGPVWSHSRHFGGHGLGLFGPAGRQIMSLEDCLKVRENAARQLAFGSHRPSPT
jgi:hypothetical protein